MKKIALQISIVILATCSALFAEPQSASAQVDMSLLTEVTKSCQKDTKLPEYYKQMGFDDETVKSEIGSVDSLRDCIKARYHYSLVQSKFPWLASTGEMISGYPGSVVVSLLASWGNQGFRSGTLSRPSLLDCIVSQDPSNIHCISSIKIFSDTKTSSGHQSVYICPSCVVANDNVSSDKRMTESFIQWFLSLDKPTRRKVLSILGEGQKAADNRSGMNTEAERALAKYTEIREKVEQQEQERRRREVIGN